MEFEFEFEMRHVACYVGCWSLRFDLLVQKQAYAGVVKTGHQRQRGPIDIEKLCAAPPESLAHSPSQMCH